MPSENKIEPIVLLLFGGMIFFTFVLIGTAHYFPNDGQTFQVIAGLLTAMGGAFMMRVKPKGSTDDPLIPMPPTPNTVTTRKVEETTARSDDK